MYTDPVRRHQGSLHAAVGGFARKWSQSYSWCIHTSSSRVASTCWPGDWLTSSRLPSNPPTAVHLPRRQRGRSAGAAGGMPPITSSSSPFPTPVGTFTGPRPYGTWHQCSRHACRENCLSYSDRGHRSVGHPSTPWPSAAAPRSGLLCHYPWQALPSSSSRRDMRIWGGRCARVRGWRLYLPGLWPCHGAHFDAPWRGRPSCSRGCGRYWTGCCSHHSMWKGLVLFTVDNCTVSQALVFVARCSWCARSTGGPSIVSASASSACSWPHCQTAVRPYQRQAKWSAVQNSTWPLSAVTRCPVMTQDSVQFSGDVCVGSGRANPDFLTGRRVTPLSGMPSTGPSNSSETKVSLSAFSTRPKASSMPGVIRYKNAHSCWSDFCSPEYSDCGCLQETWRGSPLTPPTLWSCLPTTPPSASLSPMYPPI